MGTFLKNKQQKLLGHFIVTLFMKYRLQSLFNITNIYVAYSHVVYLLSLIQSLNCVVVCLVKAAQSKILKTKNAPLKSTTVSNVPFKHFI